MITTGYGGDRRAELRWPSVAAIAGPPEVALLPFPPGLTALVALDGRGFAAADPLLDGWLLERAAPSRGWPRAPGTRGDHCPLRARHPGSHF